MPLINQSCAAFGGSCGIGVTWGTCLVGFRVFMVVEGKKGRLQVWNKKKFLRGAGELVISHDANSAKQSRRKEEEKQVGGVNPGHYDPGATGGPLSFSFRPSELEDHLIYYSIIVICYITVGWAVHLLLLQPQCQISEPTVTLQSKSLPTQCLMCPSGFHPHGHNICWRSFHHVPRPLTWQ